MFLDDLKTTLKTAAISSLSLELTIFRRYKRAPVATGAKRGIFGCIVIYPLVPHNKILSVQCVDLGLPAVA
jgi:hypothetical protein